MALHRCGHRGGTSACVQALRCGCRHSNQAPAAAAAAAGRACGSPASRRSKKRVMSTPSTARGRLVAAHSAPPVRACFLAAGPAAAGFWEVKGAVVGRVRGRRTCTGAAFNLRASHSQLAFVPITPGRRTRPGRAVDSGAGDSGRGPRPRKPSTQSELALPVAAPRPLPPWGCPAVRPLRPPLHNKHSAAP